METLQGTEDNRRQLNHWMDQRRKELRLRWAQVAERAGMGTPNLLRIRTNKISISWDAADGIEDALQWKRGSVEAIVLRNEPPTPKDNNELPHADAAPSRSSTAIWTAEMEAFYQVLKARFDAEGLEMNEANVRSAIDQLRIELPRRVARQQRIPDDRR